MKILFVCTWNASRSPIAEALYRKAAAEAGRLDAVISRGTATNPKTTQILGDVWPSSIVLRQSYDIDISRHVPAAVSAEDIGWADLILTMTERHVVELRHRFVDRPDLRLDGKLHTFGNYLGLPGASIEDPTGTTSDVYLRYAKKLKLWTEFLVEKLNSRDIKPQG